MIACLGEGGSSCARVAGHARARSTCFVAVVAASLLLAGAALAQQGTATIVGTVRDAATDAPLSDVIVTVTSPSLQGDSAVVTDATGTYRIPGLPPGSYSLALEKPTFSPYTHAAIELRADNTIRVNALMVPAKSSTQEMIVVGHAPVIDVESSSTGANVSSTFTSRVPMSTPGSRGSASRSFESVSELAPGAHEDSYGVSISGTTSPENQFLVDGLSVRNPAYGLLGTPLSLDFLKEVSVISGGYMPEYGRANGGVLNAITKTGSNEVHGSVFASLAPGALEGPRTAVHRESQTIVTEPSLSYLGNVGTDVGGPIILDKVWFYAGFDWAKTRYKLHRSLYRTLFDDAGDPLVNDDGETTTEKVPGTDEDFYANQDALQMIGKLNWAVDKRNDLTLTAFATPTFSGGDGEFGINPATDQPEIGTGTSLLAGPLNGSYDALAHRYLGTSVNVLLNWSNELDGKRLMLDTSVGWHHQSGGRLPSDDSEVGSSSGLAGISNVWWQRNDPPHSIDEFEDVPDDGCKAPADNPDAIACPVVDYHTGGPEFIDEQSLNTYQGRSVLTYNFEGAGDHVAKLGFELEVATYDHLAAYSGARDYSESTDGTYFLDGRQYGYLVGPDDPVILPSLDHSTESVTVGGFVQDNWYLNDQLTVNLGLRYDAQLLYSADGELAMSLPNQWSPRVGVVYDPTGEGASKIYANVARYYESVPLDVMDRTGSGEPLLFAAHDPTLCDPLSPDQQQNECLAPDNYIPIGNPPNDAFVVSGAGKTPVDPDIVAPSNDELVLGGEYEILRDGRLGLSYTKRWLNATIEDMSRDEAQTYFLGNPGRGIASDFPDAVRRYDAVTLYFEKVLSYHWLGQASYTISYLRGNYAGLFRSEDQQLDPNMNSDFDLKSLTVNRTGPLPGDHTHSIKLFAARDIPIEGSGHVTVGGAVRARSGEPTSFLGAHVLYGPDQVYILPRGSGERLPWVFSTDLRLAYGFEITPTDVLSITCDIFNLFNFQAVTGRDERYTNAPVSPVSRGTVADLQYSDGSRFDPDTDKNPNFGRATEYQPPRIFRFGLRMTY